MLNYSNFKCFLFDVSKLLGCKDEDIQNLYENGWFDIISKKPDLTLEKVKDYVKNAMDFNAIYATEVTDYDYGHFNLGPLGNNIIIKETDSYEDALNSLRKSTNIAGFKGFHYNIVRHYKGERFYRVGDKDSNYGNWYTKIPTASVIKARLDSAIKMFWEGEKGIEAISYINSLFSFELNEDIEIYEGPIASQGDIFHGGEEFYQYFIPVKLALTSLNYLGSCFFKYPEMFSNPINKVKISKLKFEDIDEKNN